MRFDVKFWGVRGSTPCFGADYTYFGGHTSCVSLELENNVIFLDAGSGIYDASRWVKKSGITHATLLLSHVHLDHITGFPFFQPLYDPYFYLHVVAGTLKNPPYQGIEHFLHTYLFDTLFFPVKLQDLQAQIMYSDITPEDTLRLSPTGSVSAFPLNHPGGAMGYRIDQNGVSMCYLSDMEHRGPEPEKALVSFIQNADLVIYDATFTDEEYMKEGKAGWGHSTWQAGIRLCKQANVGKLALFHHAPEHTDLILKKIKSDVQALWPHAFLAAQGMAVSIVREGSKKNIVIKEPTA